MKSLILALAAARLTQLVVDDEITRPAREKVQELSADAEYAPPPARNLRAQALDKLDTAINCHACSSVWAGGTVLAAEHGGRVGRFLVRTLALSQAALAVKSVIERIDR